MAKKVIRVKVKDTNARLIANLMRCRPRSEGAGGFDITRSTESYVTGVKYFLKTGVSPIDDSTLGYPFGRIVEIYGPEGSSKTALGLQACYQAKNAREIYERTDKGLVKLTGDFEVVALYIDVEGSMDDNHMMEVNGERVDVIVASCETVEDFFGIFEKIMTDINKIAAETKKLHFLVVVVDTVAALATKQELKADWKKDDYPRQAKFFRRGFRRVKKLLNGKNVLLICNNQVGDNFKKQMSSRGGPPDDGLLPPIGKAIKYWSRLRIYVWLHNGNVRMVKGASSSAGFIAGFYVKKNSQGPKPCVQGRYVLLYRGNDKIKAGLNDLYSKLEHMCYAKVAKRDEEGRISFFFKKFHVPVTTFDVPAASLEEDEEGRGGKKNPSCLNRAQYFQFYQDHKADLDLLYEKSMELTRQTEGIDVQDIDADEDDDDNLDDDTDIDDQD